MKKTCRLFYAVASGMLAIVILCGCWWKRDTVCTPRDEFGDTYTAEAQSYQTEVLELVNAEREKQGLEPLALAGDTVNAVAQQRAEELVEKFSHERNDGTHFYDILNEKDVRYTCGGENIAFGLNCMDNAETVVDAWMASETHRANILKADFTKLGVGCYVRTTDEGVWYYWVQIFVG